MLERLDVILGGCVRESTQNSDRIVLLLLLLIFTFFFNALGSKGSRGLKIKFKNTYKSWKARGPAGRRKNQRFPVSELN